MKKVFSFLLDSSKGGEGIMKKVFSFLLVVSLIVSSVITANKVDAKEKNNYTGESLFEAVFFGYGKASTMLDEYWENVLPNDYEYSKSEVKKIKQLERKLKKVDPNFFTKFKKGIESGNPILVNKTFKETEKALTKVFAKEISKEKAKAKSKDRVKALGVKPGFVVGLAYAYVGVTHIAAAFAVTVVAVGTKVVGPKTVQTDNILSKEMYIGLISENLAK